MGPHGGALGRAERPRGVPARAAGGTTLQREREREREMLEWRDRWGRTAVHWAVLNGHVACLRALLAVWPLTKLVLLWYQG
jgi:hypothetical protein